MRAKTDELEELQTKFKTLQKQRLEDKRELAELTQAKKLVFKLYDDLDDLESDYEDAKQNLDMGQEKLITFFDKSVDVAMRMCKQISEPAKREKLLVSIRTLRSNDFSSIAGYEAPGEGFDDDSDSFTEDEDLRQKSKDSNDRRQNNQGAVAQRLLQQLKADDVKL